MYFLGNEFFFLTMKFFLWTSTDASSYLQLLWDRINVGEAMPLSNSEEDSIEDKLVTDEVRRICPVPKNQSIHQNQSNQSHKSHINPINHIEKSVSLDPVRRCLQPIKATHVNTGSWQWNTQKWSEPVCSQYGRYWKQCKQVYQHDVFHVLIDLQKNSKKIPKKLPKITKNRQKSKKKSLYDGEYASITIFFFVTFSHDLDH